jgi:Domain of unknown function (DUF6933)
MQTVWNVLTIRCTRKLLKLLGAEAIADPPSPTNRLGNWYPKVVFVRHVALIICISERSLLPVIVEASGASYPRFRAAARSVLQGIGAGPNVVGREVREVGSFAIGVTANRRVLGSLTSLQRRLVKTGGRLIQHARYNWLLLAESHLTRRLFAGMLQKIAALPSPTG